MPKAAPIQTSFNAGELSPLMYGRVDFDKYKSGLGICLNHIPLVQGPATRRPGTVFVNAVKDSTKKTRLVRFIFSTTQAYVLEFGNQYVRIYANHGQVQNAGNPVEVANTPPYLTADLPSLMFTQSADTLYIAHPNYPPATITRLSATSWSWQSLAFTDGPYLNQNITSTTLTPGATSGSTTLVAASTTGINGGAGFQSTDVGRPVRAQISGGAWGWGTITAVADTTHATVNVVQSMGVGAVTVWRLGAFTSAPGNYPQCVTFYQDRLIWGGPGLMPESVYASVTGNYISHQPTAYDTAGTVIDSHGLSFTLNSEDVQNIRWMSGDANGLLIGTQSGEWAASPSSLNEALTPTNINAKQMTSYGNAQVHPIRVGYTTLMLQRSLRKIRELTFVYYENRYHAPDMTVTAQHITLGGVVDMSYQQEPNSIIWAVRADGTLLGFTYERDQSVVGWHRHILGGVSDSLGTQAKVESVCCIPAPDGTRDEVWMIVQRFINGVVTRQIEYMTKIWERGDSQTTATYVDASLTYSGAPATVISGLTHLPGETVAVLADGSVHPNCVVSAGGQITLSRSASTVVAGYAYNSDGQTLRNDAGAGDGTAQGKTQRKHRVAFRLHDSLGLKAGPDFNTLTRRIVRTGGNHLNQAVPLFSGDDTDTWEGDYSLQDLICWRFDQPLPGTIEAIMPQQLTIDR